MSEFAEKDAPQPETCPMDTDRNLNQCPHDVCWLARSCRAINRVTPLVTPSPSSAEVSAMFGGDSA